MLSILATKLHRPPLPARRIERPHLVQRLNDSLAAEKRITLVSAPAGFGKTICVSEWLQTISLPVCWLTLDPSNDTPDRFFLYLLAALQNIRPGFGQEIEGVLRSGEIPPGEMISAMLINELLAWPQRCILVLDDFHNIKDQFVLQVLETLVTNLPPVLHIVLITREDPLLPLARLRANNQMTELRAADLRLAPDEAAHFLNETMGLTLAPPDIRALEDRTEGWLAGLQLAGLSVRGQSNPTGFIARLRGSHRYILEYLVEEVLNRQPEAIRRFLLQTSILQELNTDLANAVTGREDSHLVLDQLLRNNLFLIPLDDAQHWYRYHHLFAESLRNMQYARPRFETNGLHQRASQWYKGAGMPDEAVAHALAAADYDLAVSLIEDHALDVIMQWRTKTVTNWTQSIPASWTARSARINLAFAWAYLLGRQLTLAAPYLERLVDIFAASPPTDDTLAAEWLAMQATWRCAEQKAAEGLALAQRALQIVPEDAVQVRGLVYLGLAETYRQLDDHPRTMDAYQLIIRYGQSAGNLVLQMQGISGLGLIALENGHLHLAYKVALQGVELVERSRILPPVSMAVYGELGQVYYEWHHLEQAKRCFLQAIQVGNLSGFSDAELYYGVILSRLYHMQGDLDAAARQIQKAVDAMQLDAPAAVGEEVVAQYVRICLVRGRLDAAEAALGRYGFWFEAPLIIPDLATGEVILRPAALLYNSALRVLLHRARARHDQAGLAQALALADRMLAAASQRQYGFATLATLLVRAQIHAALGDEAHSHADYRQAVDLAEPEGFISTFLEEGAPVVEALAPMLSHGKVEPAKAAYVERILTAFSASRMPGATPAAHGNPPAEDQSAPLSRRELEVLRLVCEGCSNQEIADRLVVTLHTVKKHTSNIYMKLGVSSRTQAVAKARQLGLI